MAVTHYRNGDKNTPGERSAKWANLTNGVWCWYNNDSLTGAVYGKLYNWYAIDELKGFGSGMMTGF